MAPDTMSKTTVTTVRASPSSSSSAAPPPVLRKERGESDDSDNTDSEEEGYDSDVQHDRKMDYNTRILIDPLRGKTDKKEAPRPIATGRRPA
jgi:hypothetical protein